MDQSAMTQPTSPSGVAANPFYTVSTLPFNFPPFDAISDADYLPAFSEGMRQQLAEVALIAAATDDPTFDNTIVAMERSGCMLSRVAAVFFNLNSAHTNDVLEDVARAVSPALAAHRDAISLDARLFDRIEALHVQRDRLQLDPESKRLVERYYADFRRAGALLTDADKMILTNLNAEMATLETRFSQNVMKEISAASVIVDFRNELDGLSDIEIAAAAEAAKIQGHEGKFLLTLTNTTGQPIEASLLNRALRQRVHHASIKRGSNDTEFDNRALVLRLVALRAERARLLGYPNHAAYILDDETARTTTSVNALLADLAPAALANARAEATAMQKLIDIENGGFEVAAHDWAFYTEKVRKDRYSFDQSELRPYLEMNSVLQNGVFFAATQLYGLQFSERNDLPVYHPDVRVYEISDDEGKPVALFLADWYARSSKRGGAWMNEYVSQASLFGTLPVVGNHMNITKPPEGEPTLMTFDEVTTMFHEFGHALHGMFSKVRYPRFSGTNVPRDFVEFPSQVNEMWADWPEVLANYAKHYNTGESLPQALLDKVVATRSFNQGFATTEYLAAAILDQYWHQLAPGQVPTDALAFEAASLEHAGIDFALVPPRYRSTYFSHVFAGGYSAGYYAYMWSEVLDADSVNWFKENGGLLRKNGDWFRQQVLSRGGSADAMELYLGFRGNEPSIAPLLERRGLKPVIH